MGSILSIYFLKLIIDHLNSPSPDTLYGVYLFVVFTIGRLAAVVARGYYDLHVYNYFRFVQTQIQCWLFELACNLPQWKVGHDKASRLVNILTKDIEVFVDGSWCYPYLIMVPLNTVVSAIILLRLFGPIALVCYLGMFLLVVLQVYSNKVLATLQSKTLAFSDKRIEYITNLIQGIRYIKVRCLENFYQG